MFKKEARSAMQFGPLNNQRPGYPRLLLFRMLMVAFCFSILSPALAGQEADTDDKNKVQKKSDTKDPLEKINQKLGKLRKLPEGKVWINLEKKWVVVDGMICLTKGPLEMFACPPSTKEHESIVQADAKSFIVHTALLMVGAKAGKPVAWEPKYSAASGTKVEIDVHWLDKDGKHQKCRAQDMIRNVRTKKPMTQSWVFAGSEFYTNPNTKVRTYMADGGEMVCVSNFTTAMLDLPIESSQSNQGLIFEALTEKIPPLRTRVRIVLKPIIKDEKKKSDKKDSGKKDVGKQKESEVG